MIKLINLLKEHSEEEKPYMYSRVGFSCKMCSYMKYNKDEGAYTCGSAKYQQYMGTHFLVKEDRKTKLTNEDLPYYCSNWFEPKGQLNEKCWDGYMQQGMKKKGDRMVPNCVRVSEEKKKIKKAYLTKDASAMKKEIDRVSKLSDDDPSAYNKWEADYADKGKTKKYKTKKSVATTAYEKKFGKKK